MRKLVYLVLAMLFVMPLCAAASTQTVETATTNATITFEEGPLWFSTEEGAMNIEFGTQDLPVGKITYENTKLNTLSIADARYPAGNWQVKVSRTGKFTTDKDENTKEFEGVLMLSSGTVSHSGGEGDGIIVDEVLVAPVVLVGTDVNLVVNAAPGQTTGTFQINWNKENITLDLSGAEAAGLVIDSKYSETLTWTLENVEP